MHLTGLWDGRLSYLGLLGTVCSTELWEGSFSNLGLLGAEKQGMRLQDPTCEGQTRAAT